MLLISCPQVHSFSYSQVCKLSVIELMLVRCSGLRFNLSVCGSKLCLGFKSVSHICHPPERSSYQVIYLLGQMSREKATDPFKQHILNLLLTSFSLVFCWLNKVINPNSYQYSLRTMRGLLIYDFAIEN